VASDVTEWRHAEKAARVQKTVLEAVVEASTDGVLVVASDGKTLAYNRRLLEIWGVTEELIRQQQTDERITEIVTGKVVDPHALLARVKWYFANPAERGHDRIELKDGRLLDRYTAPIAGTDGAVYGRVWFFHDSTEEEVAKARLRSLASELTLLEERERRQLATTLHDRVSQALALSQMKLDALKPSLAPGAALEVERVNQMLEEALAQTRNLTSDLSSPVLHQLGLSAALQWLADRTEEQAAIEVQFESDGEPASLDEETKVLLFQAARELLMNTIKHARAQHCTVAIHQDQAELRIRVEDDGVGFDGNAILASNGAKRNCFGLFNIRERLTSLGGRLECKSAAGRGARFALVVPADRCVKSKRERKNG